MLEPRRGRPPTASSVGARSPSGGSSGDLDVERRRRRRPGRARGSASRRSMRSIRGSQHALAVEDEPAVLDVAVDDLESAAPAAAPRAAAARRAAGGSGRRCSASRSAWASAGVARARARRPACRARGPARRRSRSRSRRPWPARRGRCAGASIAPPPSALVHPRGHRGRDAVLGQQEQRAARGRRACCSQDAHRRLELAPCRCPGPRAARARVAVDDRPAPSSPWRASSHAAPRGPTCLTDAQQRDQRVRSLAAPTLHAARRAKLPPVARMVAPRALRPRPCSPSWTWASAPGQRRPPRRRSLTRGEHREAAVVGARQRTATISAARARGFRHATRVRRGADRPRRQEGGDPLCALIAGTMRRHGRAGRHPHRDRHAVRRRLNVDEEAFVELHAPPCATTARTASSSAARPARPRR